MFATKAVTFVSTVCVILAASLGTQPTLAATGVTPADPPPDVPGNLLANPGFESPYSKQCCHDEPNYPANLPIDEVQVAHGWSGWWRQPAFPNYPPRCDDAQAPKKDCVAFHRPEWRDAATGGATFDAYRNRIHSGSNAQKYFTFYSVHESGMLQQVNNVQAGQRLRFTAYMQAWSSNTQDLVSSGQQTMNLKVGIDPYGGTDPFSGNIVWSDPGNSYDVYGLFAVEAVAQTNRVTVFTYSRPIYGLQHNDVYVDDAALVVVGAGAVQPVVAVQPPAEVPVVAQAPVPVIASVTGPLPGTTVDPNGNLIYVVQPGDTTFSLARRFGTSVQQLMIWNSLYSSTYILAWTPLIVGKTTPGAQAVAVAPAPTEVATAQPVTVGVAPVSPYPGTSVDSYGDIVYLVQPGDTTFSIALRFHTTVWQIVNWNYLYSSTYIQAGQLLIVGKI